MMRVAAWAAMAAVCAQGLFKTCLWKAAEPRVMTIAREQLEHGLLSSMTFSGMPFLEKPALYYDLTSVAFLAAGEPSVLAARAVVALLGLILLAAVAAMVRRALGPGAGTLAAFLVAISPAFTALVRRLGVDVSLAASLTVALCCLAAALAQDDEQLDRRWFAASLLAAGFAALSKGVFGTFLFVAPTGAYALLARDRRLGRALLHPTSLLLLALPHAAWGLVLYASGGTTFVFEHFVNNTLGRALHVHLDVAGAGALPYGDVGNDYDWWYYLRFMPTSALPAIAALPWAVAEQRSRGGAAARDPRSRLFVLCMTWGVVPPVLLSFSSYKGRGHLAASSVALVVAAVVWLAPRTLARDGDAARRDAPRAAWYAVTLLCFASAALVVCGAYGIPAARTPVLVVFGATGAVLAALLFVARRTRSAALAVFALCASVAVGLVADFTPGGRVDSDARNSMDAASRWVAAESAGLPVGVFYPAERPMHDPIGWARENEVATLTWWLGRPVTRLTTIAEVHAYLESDRPGFFVARRERDRPKRWPARPAGTVPGVGWTAEGGNADDVFLLVANVAAARLHPHPSFAPPGPPRH